MAINNILVGTAVSGNNASQTPTNPSHQAGDKLLCFCWVRSATATISCSTAGWAAADGITNPIGLTSARLYIFQNEADSAAESNPVCTLAGGANGVTVSAVVVRVRGQDNGQNLTLGTVANNAANTTTIAFGQNSPSIDPGNAIFALGYKLDDASAAWGGLAGQTAGLTWTSGLDHRTTQGNDQSCTIDYAVNNTGSAYTAGTGATKSGTTTSVTSNGVYLEIPAARALTGTPSLDAFLSAAAAKAVVEGIGSGTLNPFASTATAEVLVEAAASPALDAFTTSATATVSSSGVTAQGSPVIAAFTASAAGKVIVEAVAAPSFAAFTSAAAAKALVEGLGSGVLNAFGASATAKVAIEASVASALGSFTATAAARVAVEAQAAPAMGHFTLAAQAALKSRLNGAPALSPFISDAAARALIEGAGSGELNPFGLDGALALPIHAAAAPALESFAAGGQVTVRVGAQGGAALAAFTATGTIGSLGPRELAGSPVLGLFTSSGQRLVHASRCIYADLPCRAVAGPVRPSRHLAPNLQRRHAAG